MKRLISQFRKRSFLQGFLRGLSSPAEVYQPYRHVAKKRSPMASMRRDWEMIGGDFRSVMSREHDDTRRERNGPWQASVALVGVPLLGVVQAFIRGRDSDTG